MISGQGTKIPELPAARKEGATLCHERRSRLRDHEPLATPAAERRPQNHTGTEPWGPGSTTDNSSFPQDSGKWTWTCQKRRITIWKGNRKFV